MSDIRVKSTELHFFFRKIVTVFIFTFTISSSFNYVYSGSADAPAISNQQQHGTQNNYFLSLWKKF